MAALDVSYAAEAVGKETVSGGEDYATEWVKAWNFTNATTFLKYPGENVIATPSGWWHLSPCGVSRAVMMFDTTGLEGNKALFLWNDKAGTPCWSASSPGAEDWVYVLNDNSLTTDFDASVYSWIKDRFSDDYSTSPYYVTKLLLSDITCQSWGEVYIPRRFINTSGYTTLMLVLKDDYDGYAEYASTTTISSYWDLARVELAYLETPTVETSWSFTIPDLFDDRGRVPSMARCRAYRADDHSFVEEEILDKNGNATFTELPLEQDIVVNVNWGGISQPNKSRWFYVPFVDVDEGGTGASTAAEALSNLGLGTEDSPQFTAINLGDASDTTLARIAPGRVSIEGKGWVRFDGSISDNEVVRFSGTTGDLIK